MEVRDFGGPVSGWVVIPRLLLCATLGIDAEGLASIAVRLGRIAITPEHKPTLQLEPMALE